MFVLCLTTIVSFGALSLGGSLAYSAERNAQTSADAAAVAATEVMRRAWVGEASASAVAATATDVATQNGAETVVCEVVRAGYALSRTAANVIGTCTTANVMSTSAAGIRVTVGDRRDVPFGKTAGTEQLTARAQAAATAQPLRGGRSPFMVCTNAWGHPAPVLLPDASLSVPWRVNPSAIGAQYVLHGNAMKDGGRQCGGTSSSWRGLVEFESEFGVPGWWGIKTGNTSGALPRLLAGDNACSLPADGSEDVLSLTIGCRLMVPLCITSNFSSGSGLELYCVRMGTFEITWIGKVSPGDAPCLPGENDNNLICGRFVGGAQAISGDTGSSTPTSRDIVVVKLVQ